MIILLSTALPTASCSTRPGGCLRVHTRQHGAQTARRHKGETAAMQQLALWLGCRDDGRAAQRRHRPASQQAEAASWPAGVHLSLKCSHGTHSLYRCAAVCHSLLHRQEPPNTVRCPCLHVSW